MRFFSALNFYTKFIEKLHLNLKPFYDLLHKNTLWTWTAEHETLFQNLKNALTFDTQLTVPIKNNEMKVISLISVYLTLKNKNSLHETVNYLVKYLLFNCLLFN